MPRINTTKKPALQLGLLILVLFFSGFSWGQVIISWDFTSGTTPNTNAPGGTTALNFNTGGTIASSGCTGNGYSSNNWNVNEYFQIVAPTTGYNITTVTFNVASSGTGPRNFKIQYSSTGTGGAFSDLGTTFISPNGTPCTSVSADFTAINALDNNANTVIRLVFTGGEADGSPASGDAASGGTFRIDDLIINGFCIAPATDPTGSITVSVNPSCGPATLSYTTGYYWQTSATGTDTTKPTSANYTLNATGTIYVRGYNGSCWSTNSINTGTITINTAPAVTADPPSRIIAESAGTTFTVAATGTGVTYQWQVDTGGGFGNIPAGAPYSGINTATLSISAVTIGMTGYLYRCVVTGTTPCGSTNSNSGSLTVTNASPNNATALSACYGNTFVTLSWTAATGTPAPDGYVVFAIQSATAPAAATPNDASTYAANANFSAGSIVAPATLGKCVYKGTGTSVTITGLTNGVNYSYTVIAYKGATATGWATGKNVAGSWRITNTSVDTPDVTGFSASVANTQSVLSWTHVTNIVTCGYEYLIVANQGAVVFTPTGNGSAYTANPTYSSANQVVYKGTGNNMTVSGLTNGLNYCYKIFVRNGTEWSDGVSACAVPGLAYCTANGNTTFATSVTNVTLNTINNSSAKPSGYSDYTAISTNVTAGLSYPLSMRVNTAGNYEVDVYAWIDFNRNGVFTDAGEAFSLGSATNVADAAPLASPLIITIPATASVGSTRMRVMASYDLGVNSCSTAIDGEVEDYTITILAGCTYANVTSITPNSAPIGTEIRINAASGLSGATATIGGLAMTVVSSSATQLIVKIPAGASSGDIVVTNAASCAGLPIPYIVINEDKTSCEGSGGTFGDLIISEIFDTASGNGLYIEIYNPTNAAINVVSPNVYKILIDNDKNGVLNGVNRTINITGTIPAGGAIIYNFGTNSPTESPCTGVSTINLYGPGTNANDGVYLTKNGTVIDMLITPNDTGYSMSRKITAIGPTPVFNSADWNSFLTESCSDLGLFPANPRIAPTVSLPVYTPNCKTATVTVTTAEGNPGSNGLVHLWYALAPGATNWTALSNAGIYSGADSAVLSISNISTVIDYQYYCQVMENTSTCFTASNAVKISNGGAAVWNAGWTNGPPTIDKLVIINGAYDTDINGNIDACSMTVNAPAIITDGHYFNIDNDLTVSGTGSLTVNNNGSLVQKNDLGVNSGSITMKRDVTLKRLDYVYWSSPLETFNVSNILLSMPTNMIFKWDPIYPNPNGGQGFWRPAAGNNMDPGLGFIARGPITLPTTSSTITATFSGDEPNNGVITQTIRRGDMIPANLGSYTSANGIPFTAKDDNYNLIGNPYPSAISANLFLSYNTTAPNNVIEGAVRIWTHGKLPANFDNPFYNTYTYNYDVNDYITYNGTATTSGPGGFSGFIASGQGFFVVMHDGTAASATVTFKNSMRVKGDAPTSNNSDFFKNNATQSENEVKRHRIWLDMVSSTGTVDRTVVGYVTDATLDKDNMYDAYSLGRSNHDFYSLINDEKMCIQGRPLPFDNDDQVKLGVKIPDAGTFNIAIADVDGLFANSNEKIYLEDKELSIIHDLRQAPYSFSANAGTFNDRFVLRYKSQNLGNQDFQVNANNIIVAADEQQIKLKSYAGNISEVTVYDVLGREIFFQKASDTEFFIKGLTAANQALIVKVKLENGQTASKKVIF